MRFFFSSAGRPCGHAVQHTVKVGGLVGCLWSEAANKQSRIGLRRTVAAAAAARRGVVVVGHTVSLLDKQSSRPPSQNISEAIFMQDS